MRKILEDFFYGKLYPYEKVVPQKPEYLNTHNKISEIEETLKSKMQAEDYKLIERIECLFGESSTLYGESCFSYGFKIGILLMCEVFSDKPDFIPAEKE